MHTASRPSFLHLPDETPPELSPRVPQQREPPPDSPKPPESSRHLPCPRLPPPPVRIWRHTRRQHRRGGQGDRGPTRPRMKQGRAAGAGDREQLSGWIKAEGFCGGGRYQEEAREAPGSEGL